MSLLVLIRGLPGSGKSTFARNMNNVLKPGNVKVYGLDNGECQYVVENPSVHLEADMFYTDYDGKYNFSTDLLSAAHTWCINTARIFMNAHYNVIVSNTFTTLKEMKPYLEHAEKNNIKIVVYRMASNFGSIHSVPEETIKKMSDRFQNYDGELVIKHDF